MAQKQMELTVEVYRREPIFLREHLQGAAVVQMKEYLEKFAHGEERSEVIEETGSFQLRRRKSDKAHGFVDISIRICNQEDDHGRFSGLSEGLKNSDQVGITLAIEDGPVYNYPPPPYNHYRGHSEDADHYSNSRPVIPGPRPDPSPLGSNYSYQPPMFPSTLPLPPTSNLGFFPPQHPGREQVPQNYINLPPRKPAGQNNAPNFGMGLGAGALTAGTMIFGETLLPGPSFSGALSGASLSVSSDAPF